MKSVYRRKEGTWEKRTQNKLVYQKYILLYGNSKRTNGKMFKPTNGKNGWTACVSIKRKNDFSRIHLLSLKVTTDDEGNADDDAND